MSVDQAPPETVHCARHRQVETVLRCGRCETPICPRCAVATPVGSRCPTCAGVRKIATVAGPWELARAAAMGLLTALLGSVALAFIPFLTLIGQAALGYFTGWSVSNAVRLRRGLDVALIAVGVFVLGQWLAPAVVALLLGRTPSMQSVLLYPIALAAGAPIQLLGIALGAFLAWMRSR